jgi:hypothetical protein
MHIPGIYQVPSPDRNWSLDRGPKQDHYLFIIYTRGIAQSHEQCLQPIFMHARHRNRHGHHPVSRDSEQDDLIIGITNAYRARRFTRELASK